MLYSEKYAIKFHVAAMKSQVRKNNFGNCQKKNVIFVLGTNLKQALFCQLYYFQRHTPKRIRCIKVPVEL